MGFWVTGLEVMAGATRIRWLDLLSITREQIDKDCYF